MRTVPAGLQLQQRNSSLRKRGCTETRREVSMPGTRADDRRGLDVLPVS